jgi:anti-sigma factor RsiW
MRCDDGQDRLLDLVYGLLDPAEAAALEAHVASCPACEAAYKAVRGEKALIARAAKGSFARVEFIPPIVGGIEPRRPVPRTVFVRWAVAAGLLLAVAGTVGPTIHSAIRSAAADRGTKSAL